MDADKSKDVFSRAEVLVLLEYAADNYNVTNNEFTKNLVPNFHYPYSPETVLKDFENAGGLNAPLKRKKK